MTEAEAKTKWCHQARFTGTPSDDLVPNRSDPIEDSTRCIASDCMAWRWLPSNNGADKIQAIRNHREKYGSTLVEAKNAIEATWVDIATQGFCGLAGAQ